MKPKRSTLWKNTATKLQEGKSFRKGVNGQQHEIILTKEGKCSKMLVKWGN